MRDKCGRQVGDKCENYATQDTQSERQVWGDKWKTSVKSCASRHPEWETRVGNKWETSVKSCGPSHPEWETSVGDKEETSVKSCGPRYPEWETSKWETSGRQV